MISVVEVIRAEGFKYTKRLAWATGRAVAREWRTEHQTAPQYAMRPKALEATGSGEHMKAVYPDEWRPRIVRIVAGYADVAPKPERNHQSGLFGSVTSNNSRLLLQNIHPTL